MEKLRESDIDEFIRVLGVNKRIVEIAEAFQSYDDIEELTKLYECIDDKDLLSWSLNKIVKISILRANITLVHFLLIKCSISLDSQIHSSIINDYIGSLKEIDFIECDDAIMNIFVSILELLITFRANINYKDLSSGNNIIHNAVINKQIQFIIVLAKNGAKYFEENYYGINAWGYASEKAKNDDDVIFKEIVNILDIYLIK
jgi:hypothetical protein